MNCVNGLAMILRNSLSFAVATKLNSRLRPTRKHWQSSMKWQARDTSHWYLQPMIASTLMPPSYAMSCCIGDSIMHLRLPWLLQHYPRTPILALFNFINGSISIGLMAAIAVLAHSPFIFPSLGPTAFLFFDKPTEP